MTLSQAKSGQTRLEGRGARGEVTSFLFLFTLHERYVREAKAALLAAMHGAA